ncbi:MAG: hypothetical protein P4M05_28275 [Bradyrhizobium sp.]|nr:hypothetical protein [Bradyrhizobium sp.]
MSQAEITTPRALTSDIGLAIRDLVEFRNIHVMGEEKQGSVGVLGISFVDVSDADNPVVYLNNGQTFTIRIFSP